MESLKPILSQHPFFSGLDDEYLDLVAGCAANVRFKPGETVFHEGEEAHQFYLIRHGKVALESYASNRGALTVQTLDEGDILGWSWLIPPYYWRFDARAVDLVRAIALDGLCLRTKCEADHHLGYELLKRFSHIIGQRLDATRFQLMDVYGIVA
ncbi:MAG: cyclic nucleotide-binding domain-containing protein [Acidobacteriota bacterium]|nr:MAG: cyclic nucleotide-binding domain-containing protein [Acidobacteriota bacterium]